MTVNSRKKYENQGVIRGGKINPTISALTNRVQQLEQRVEKLESVTGILAPEWLTSHPDVRGKPGPKPALQLDTILYRRDRIIRTLEDNWPRIERGLLGTTTDEQIRETLSPYLETDTDLKGRLDFQGLSTQLIRTPIREKPRSTIFQSFRQDGERAFQRLNRLPSRILANALAGVPELSVRRSYDICASHPSINVVGLNIWIHYAKKYPDVCPIPIWEEHLLRRRDALVEMIEGNWSVLLPLISQARAGSFPKKLKAVRTLKQVLYDLCEARSELSRLREVSHFRKVLKELKSFLKTQAPKVRSPGEILKEVSRRATLPVEILNRLSSRVLANAVAGLPEVSCQRSFEICSQKPSKLPPHSALVSYYASKRQKPLPARSHSK